MTAPQFPRAAFLTGLALAAAMLGTGCGPQAPRPAKTTDLLQAAHLPLWQASAIPDQGPVEVTANGITLHPGQPMTGVRFTGDWEALQLPWIDYALTFEARRTEGRDFFATCTFPVGARDRCVSLVVGGWGGGLVGISSIDHLDASENSTRGEMRFENNRWYRLRLEVRENDLRAWINDLPMVNVSIKGRQLSLRSGDIERCTPLGFATWRTQAEIRNVRIERLKRGG
jgi:hypothetical protein